MSEPVSSSPGLQDYRFTHLKRDLHSDLKHYGGHSLKAALRVIMFSPGFQLLLNYRLLRYLYLRQVSLLGIQSFLRFLQQRMSHCYISPTAQLGRNISFPHPLGIVIGDDTVIHDNVKIFQQVTVGSHGRAGQTKAYPTLEQGCILYAGAKIIGGITLGDHATVGANAVVTSDVSGHTTVAGIPARVINRA